jgi:hypothetical protein
MFPPVLQELKSYLERAFLLGVFSPVLIFVGTSLTLYFEVTQGVGVALAEWGKLMLSTQLLLVLAGLIVVTLIAFLIYNFQYIFTRYFEGYWPRIGVLRTLRNSRTELYRRRWKYFQTLVESDGMLTKAEKDEIVEKQLTLYPPENHLDKLMPTSIGNILRAAEIYAFERYGISSTVIWTRLYPLLTDGSLAPLEGSKIARDFMLLMSVLAAIFTLIWCPILAFFTNHWLLFLLCALGWPFSWICYHNAVQRALAYSEQLKAMFDLYRHDLLEALKLPIPSDANVEYGEWSDLSDFFYNNVPMSPPKLRSDKLHSWDQVALALAEYIRRMNRSTP